MLLKWMVRLVLAHFCVLFAALQRLLLDAVWSASVWLPGRRLCPWTFLEEFTNCTKWVSKQIISSNLMWIACACSLRCTTGSQPSFKRSIIRSNFSEEKISQIQKLINSIKRILVLGAQFLVQPLRQSTPDNNCDEQTFFLLQISSLINSLCA